ncbi:hypothetical protein K0B03_00745 [Patescibacteria group bacterium]|nr:hypothetical protein [Patescibacteria group bacterium]
MTEKMPTINSEDLATTNAPNHETSNKVLGVEVNIGPDAVEKVYGRLLEMQKSGELSKQKQETSDKWGLDKKATAEQNALFKKWEEIKAQNTADLKAIEKSAEVALIKKIDKKEPTEKKLLLTIKKRTEFALKLIANISSVFAGKEKKTDNAEDMDIHPLFRDNIDFLIKELNAVTTSIENLKIKSTSISSAQDKNQHKEINSTSAELLIDLENQTTELKSIMQQIEKAEKESLEG